MLPRQGDDLEPWTLPQPERPVCASCRMAFSSYVYGYSYLWGSTQSTLVDPRYGLDFVITPYASGLALAEVVHLTNQPGDLALQDWLDIGPPITSATARFELTTSYRVIPTLETPIDVDPY